MLHVFSTNRVKLVARKPETTNNKGQREYTPTQNSKHPAYIKLSVDLSKHVRKGERAFGLVVVRSSGMLPTRI